jgi:hypothetical protein
LWLSIRASSCAKTTTRRALSVNLSNMCAPSSEATAPPARAADGLLAC